MKTKIFFLSVALFALVTLSFAKLSFNEGVIPKPVNEIIIEKELVLENWMAVPFNSIVTEVELSVEPWMTHPFGY